MQSYSIAEPNVAHRLLAPRIGFAIGTRDAEESPNFCLASNVTSVSRDPQLVLISIYKEWKTYSNLQAGKTFTITTPRTSQQDGLWILAEKYSGFRVPEGSSKIEQSGLEVQDDLPHGPILLHAIGWMGCRIVHSVEIESDHGIFIGQVEVAGFSPETLDSNGFYLSNPQPWMQLVGNTFSTSVDSWKLPFYDKES